MKLPAAQPREACITAESVFHPPVILLLHHYRIFSVMTGDHNRNEAYRMIQPEEMESLQQKK